MYQLSGKSQIMSRGELLSVFRDQPQVPGQPAVQYVNGEPVRPAPPEQLQFKIRGNIQPMMARELLLVPEGDRFKEQYWLYTPEIEKRMLINDRVQRFDKSMNVLANYQVQSVETWGDPPNGFQRCRITRIDTGTYKTP